MPTKVRLVKAMIFPVVMCGCESWTIKKAEHQRIEGFEPWCWKRLLRIPWTARRSNQSILKEISPGCSLVGLMLKLKIQYCSTPGLPVHQQLPNPPKPMSIESAMPSNHLILCGPLLLLPSIFPSIRVFSNKSALCIRWPKYWSLSFNINPSNEHPGLISFRMDWLDLLAVQGIHKESSPTPQFKSINSSALSFLYSPTLTS